MPDYIPVTRHFEQLGDSVNPRPYWLPKAGEPLTWARILNPEGPRHVVLHAPSGFGKSTEVLKAAERQRAAGRHAIFGVATALAEHGMLAGLDRDNHAAFDAWNATSAPATLFVDAVDELALRNKTLYDLIHRLGVGIPFAERHVQVVITARTGTWLPSHTGQLQNLLDPQGEPAVDQLTFAALDDAALRALAVGHGVHDVDRFLGALRDEEVGSLFEIRPTDVRWLVQKWNATRRLGKWSELLSDFSRNALEEETQERPREMSVHEGHLGLQRAAAGMLFSKRRLVSVPSAEHSDVALSARRLFDDWTITKVTDLLQTPLFVHKGMHGQVVQLAAEALAPFLAARWLAKRARAGLGVDELSHHVMVRAFGERDFHVPGSRTKLAGWLASEWPEFRSLLLTSRPEVVLFEGDPDLLTDRELEQALLGVASKLLATGREMLPTPGTLRKLARGSAESATLSILSTFPTTRALQFLALQLSRYGRYRSCVPIAVHLALDSSANVHVRREAIAVVTEAGDGPQRTCLIPLAADPSADIRTELLALVPTIINGPDLVRMMVAGGDLSFRLFVRQMSDRISDVDLDATLSALAPIVTRTNFDARSERAFAAALPLVTEFIHRGRCMPDAVAVLRAIEKHAARQMYVSTEEIAKLNSALAHNAPFRQTWLAALVSTHSPYELNSTKFGRAVFDDFPWLAAEWSDSLRRERAAAGGEKARRWQRSAMFGLLIERLYRSLIPEEQQRARELLPRQLLANVDARTARNAKSEQQIARNNAKQQRKEIKRRAMNRMALESRIPQIERGDDLRALLNAEHYLVAEQSAKRVHRNFSRLAEFAGEEMVPVFIRGLKAFWRKNPVELKDPATNEILTRNLVGLTGLTLAIDEGLDLRSLTAEEAKQAAIYALYEMNSFPYWYEDLLAAQAQIVEPVLREMISLTWDAPAPSATMLRFGPYAAPSVKATMRRLLLDIAIARPPASRQALEDGIDTLLTSDAEQIRIAHIVNAGIVTDANVDDRLIQWLRLFAHTDPLGAARHLETLRTTDAARFEKLLEGVANFLEQDLSDRYRMSLTSAMGAPRALGAWFRLLLLGVSPERDIQHPRGRAHVVGERDHAQQFRDRCLQLLRQDPTEVAHDELITLVRDPSLVTYRSALRAAFDDQFEAAREAVARPWTEEDVLALERADERPPRTLEDLFSLVRSHIAHVDRLIAKDDFSYRRVFEDSDEREIQLWAASNLRERARGLYSVVRENVVDDDKEVDISALAAGVGQVPIEIKPLGDKSLTSLEAVIQDQLLGQYMQPHARRCGILLLVRRDREKWKPKHGRHWLTLEELVESLQDFATDLGRRHGKTIVVEVIDLLRQSGSSSLRGRALPPAR